MHTLATMHSVFQPTTWRWKVFLTLQSLLLLHSIPQTMSFSSSPCENTYNPCTPPPTPPSLSPPPPPPPTPTANAIPPTTTVNTAPPSATPSPPTTPSPTNPPTPVSGPVPTATPTLDTVWVKNRYPASDFRSEVAVSKFILWPENLPYLRFNYYCEDSNTSARKLENYTYGKGATNLHTNPYFDVGLVDKLYTPFFKHWLFWQIDTKQLSCDVRCEYTDLQRLYTYRLFRNVLLVGFAWAWAALSILQLGVVVYIIVVWITHECKRSDRRFDNVFGRLLEEYKKVVILDNKWISDVISDWMHLGILVIVGFSMMEAIGHSDRFGWRSMIMYNAAVSYTYCTCLAMISSFLHQCAYYHMSLRPELISSMASSASLSESSSNSKSLVQLSEDWRWQRVFGQLGVLVLMFSYLLFVDDDTGTAMDSFASIALGAVVVGCIWSNGVSLIIAVRSIRSIFQDHPSSHSNAGKQKGAKDDHPSSHSNADKQNEVKVGGEMV